MNIPTDIPVSLQVALREIASTVERLTGAAAANVDLRGRRLINAGGALAPSDYVTRADLTDAIRRAVAASTTSTPADATPIVAPAPVTEIPGAPGNLVATIAGSTMTLSWTASTHGATTYLLEGGTMSGSTNLFNTDLGKSDTTYIETGLPTNTYYIRVRGKNAAGISAPSNEVTFTAPGNGTTPIPPPPATDPIPPSPPPSPFTGSAQRLISFQGLTVTTGAYGTLPWAAGGVTSLTPGDRALSYAAQLAAGDTWSMANLTWNYAEPGQPFGSLGVVPPRDMTTDLPGFRAIVDEMIAAGFAKVLLFLGGDGESINSNPAPGQYNDPVGWTYGHQWLMLHLAAIVATFADILDTVIFVPGYDGVMPGWDPAQLDAYLIAIRNLVGATPRCVGLELATGYSHWGSGPGNWNSASGQAVDVLLQEFFAPVTGDQVWQIAARELGPAYHRPPEQPPTDDPSPPYYLSTGTPRGARTVVAFEFDAFRWVRNQVSASQVQNERQSLANVGYAYVG